MTRFATMILLAALGAATVASAQDQALPNRAAQGSGAPGGVARLVLAQQLFALGQASKDPLAALNAARLAASVTLTDTPRAKRTLAAPPPAMPANTPTPTEMFNAATILAGEDEALLDLIETVRQDAGFAPLTNAISTASTLGAGQTETWSLAFYGASLAEIAILGTATDMLDLKVADENGNLLCQDIGPTATAYCSFYPAQNGAFLITISNTGTATAGYLLLTN